MAWRGDYAHVENGENVPLRTHRIAFSPTLAVLLCGSVACTALGVPPASAGVVRFIVMSPDRRSAVFQTVGGGTVGVMAVDLVMHRRTIALHNPACAYAWPLWLQQGRSILVQKSCIPSGADEHYAVVNAQSGAQRNLTPPLPPPQSPLCVGVSPDGDEAWIAAEGKPNWTATQLYDYSVAQSVVRETASIDLSPVYPVGVFPHDATYDLIVTGKSMSHLWVVSLIDHTGRRRSSSLHLSDPVHTRLSSTADGRRLAAFSESSGRFEVFRTTRHGFTRLAVTSLPFAPDYMSWAPDDRRLACWGAKQLWIVTCSKHSNGYQIVARSIAPAPGVSAMAWGTGDEIVFANDLGISVLDVATGTVRDVWRSSRLAGAHTFLFCALLATAVLAAIVVFLMAAKRLRLLGRRPFDDGS